MSEIEEFYSETGQKVKDSVQSQMFGKSCFKIKGKAFTCFFEDDMVFKLSGNAHSEALSLDGSKLFDPSGKNRPMKEWVQVPYIYKEKWPEFARDAANYVNSK